MSNALRIASVCCIAAFATPAAAEVLSDIRNLQRDSPMAKYLTSSEAQQNLFNLAVGIDRQLGMECKGNHNLKIVQILILNPIDRADSAPHPTSGVWKYGYDVTRCGSAKRYNALMSAKAGEAPQVMSLVPGTTISSPTLMVDTLRIAFASASLLFGPDCKDVKLLDTELVQPPRTVTQGDKVRQGVWDERWTLVGCGQTFPRNITFTPDGAGGTHIAFEPIKPRS